MLLHQKKFSQKLLHCTNKQKFTTKETLQIISRSPQKSHISFKNTSFLKMSCSISDISPVCPKSNDNLPHTFHRAAPRATKHCSTSGFFVRKKIQRFAAPQMLCDRLHIQDGVKKVNLGSIHFAAQYSAQGIQV